MSSPKVFISYSHDSEDHKSWVGKLVSRLRSSGIHVSVDTDLPPGGDIPHFMDSQLRAADFILVICTEKAVAKIDAGEGGVAYEKMIIAADLMKQTTEIKVIPIVRHKQTPKVPTYLSSKRHLDFSDEHQFDVNLNELIGHLKKASDKTTNIIDGENTNQAEENRVFELEDFMRTLKSICQNSSWATKKEMKVQARITSKRLEELTEEAIAKGYIEIGHTGNLNPTRIGVKYMDEQGIA